jgi:hypothetical protein
VSEINHNFISSIPDFSISIPDEAIEAPSKFGELTMLRLAELVDRQRK